MVVQSLSISNFKRIAKTQVPLAAITVLVGGNNSGKSCVMQAAHLAVSLLQATTETTADAFTVEKVGYHPTSDFWDIAHGKRLLTGTEPVDIAFDLVDSHGSSSSLGISISRGPGETIDVAVSENELALARLSDTTRPFSIYVPGLAGIPLLEEYRVAAAVIKGIARGDANLYLRNVLSRIQEDPDKQRQFNELLGELLPGGKLEVIFNPQRQQHIDARIIVDGVSRSIETFGTGVLQYVQIIAYVVAFEPALLLLDEPDAHLHPNNQRLIARALQRIASLGQTQIVLATHSRTMLDAFDAVDDASFVWIEQGATQTDQGKDRIGMLMSLGALDGAERFFSTNCAAILLTEDRHKEYIETLLEANGAKPGQFLVHSYQTSSQINAAILLAEFIHEVKPGVRVIVHRDRDFMTNEEIERLRAKFPAAGGSYELFVTGASDIEHYFATPDHIAAAISIEVAEAEDLTNQLLAEHQLDIFNAYRNKREEIRNKLYPDDRNACPSPIDLYKSRPAFEHCKGKMLLKKLSPVLEARYHASKHDLRKPLSTLADPVLASLIASIPLKLEPAPVWPDELTGGQCA